MVLDLNSNSIRCLNSRLLSMPLVLLCILGKVVVHPRWVHASAAAGHCLATDDFPLDDAEEREREREAIEAAAAAASDLSAEFFAQGGWRTMSARSDLPASDGLAGCVVALMCGSTVDDKPALQQVTWLY
jgi:hypothetical protein